MATHSWSPLWSSIVTSSLWHEPDYVVKVYLTMLALKDSDHVYRFDSWDLAQHSKKTELEVLDALKILASPDHRKMAKQEFDGRRIKAVEGGWLILNGEKYREKMREEMKRARNVRAAAKWRERQREKDRLAELYRDKGTPLNGETAYVEEQKRAEENSPSEPAVATEDAECPM